MDYALLQKLTVMALPMLLAITLHEAAHGYVARHFGDFTAWQQGRVSLNPVVHIDPIGTILVPMLTVFLGGIFFGWAKPVPVNFGNLRRPKQHSFWVALAGPGANLFMAFLWAAVAKISSGIADAEFFHLAGLAGVTINLAFMALNLLPILPLDGGRMLTSLLPARAAWRFSQLEPYGMIILILLLVTGLLWIFMSPIMTVGQIFISKLFSL